MDLHLKGQLDRTMSTNNFAEIVKGMRYAPRFLPLAERLSRSACNRNCVNGKPWKIFVTEVHSTYASIGLGGKGSATSGKRVSDDITLNSHPDVAAFQLIRQVTPASV
ncbi:hypothetical protein EV363DRAFT_1222176 [Boletus edulis]|nr:hypothetical protein EV363DRAFT_1222176 [Boletus edulis]